ncbi:6-phosphogluconolactonase [Dysgonamonadaceae bacterium]|nr:6-phosphogluconolactonase [Dysgonamonadaceae bacterium]
MDIRIFDTQQQLNQAFTEWLKEIVRNKDRINVALSGGSTPKSLFDEWSMNHRDDIDWNRIRFFWGDERCVSPEDEQSNYRMSREHLFDNLSIPQSHIFRIHGENDPDTEAHRYAEVLRNELPIVSGVPVFDVVMLGMGDDGHTASIFPDQLSLWYSDQLCVVGTHPQSGQRRVSLTGKVINHAQYVALLVTGENKAEKVAEIIENPQEAAKKYPAALVQPESGNLVWFLDRSAAQKLTRQ